MNKEINTKLEETKERKRKTNDTITSFFSKTYS